MGGDGGSEVISRREQSTSMSGDKPEPMRRLTHERRTEMNTRPIVILIILALLVASCGGDDGATETSAPVAGETTDC